MPKIKQKNTVNYFFIWGNFPALALVEILSAFKRFHITYHIKHCSVEAGVIALDKFLPEKFIEQLGGTIKLGHIVEHIKDNHVTPAALAAYLATEHSRGKLFFCISQYRLANDVKPLVKRTIDTIGKRIKNLLKEKS